MLAGDRVSGTDADRHEDISRNGNSGFGDNADSAETADLRPCTFTNAQIVEVITLTLRLRHHWHFVTGTSAYGCPKNDALRIIDAGLLYTRCWWRLRQKTI
jgi:hypothetical protein